ncbi:MAG: cadherin repeat domain-containing protein, partial [bacterium]|nr:cadherin repeat domain-containing protein [bacterium]
TTIQGNLLGVYADGITYSSGQDNGIHIENSSSIQIGGLADGAGNVIGGAIDGGIYLNNVTASTIQGNYIGTDVSETYDLGVQEFGLAFDGNSSGNLVGGTDADAGNVFGYIGFVYNGIGLATTATDNSLLGNRMLGFNQTPIGFGGISSSTVPANDNLDADTGSNDLQNYPIITNVQVNGSDLEITGTFNSLANTTFRLEFFGNRTAGNLGMMADYLGATSVTTDVNGDATFDITLVGEGDNTLSSFTATATEDLGGGNYGNTSGAFEYSAPVITSDGGDTSAAINHPELTTAVTTVVSSDEDGDTPTYSIVGGTDSTFFTIGPSSGDLAFATAPNFMLPLDAGANNTYEVIVRSSDPSGNYDEQTITVTVIGTNEAPSFGATLDGAPSFTEDVAAVIFDNDVAISDADLDVLNSGNGNYNGASLTLVRNGVASAEDLFSATGTLSALTESGNFDVGGTTIGTVTTNSGGTLVLTFNSSATTALVNSAMQQIAYSNSSDTPPPTAQIDWTFDDGGNQGIGGALQATGSTTVTITESNDAPVNTVPGTQTIAEETTTAIGGISISDSDADVANLSTQLQVGNGILNVTLSGGATISAGANGTGDLTILGSVTDINNTLASLTYTGDTDVIGTAADTLTVTTNDLGNTGGGGAQQDVDNIQIDLTAVSITANDASADEAGSDPGQFTVDLGATNNTGGDVTVNYTVTGTATDGGTDYTSLTGSVVIAD